MIALYRPGTSPIHRMPAGPKIAAFALIALAVGILATTPLALGIAAVTTIALYLVAGLGPLELLRQAWVLRWVILVMLVSQLIFLPPLVALTNTGRVVVVIVLAALFSLTTRVPAMLDTVERGLSPARRFGVDPAAIGLLFALTITTIPVIGRFASDIRDAQRARGVPVRPHTVVVPLLVMSLKHSDDVAEALSARGAG